MNFTKYYADTILKKIVVMVNTNMVKKEKADKTKLEQAETGSGVRTQRHWQSIASSEQFYERIETGLQMMKELDEQVDWTEKLDQDRFNFLKKYPNVIKEFCSKYSVDLEEVTE
jgi:hypothetical protein